MLDAEAKLASMEFLEPDAVVHDQETCPQFRRHFAKLYRKAIGVSPAERAEFRRWLHGLEKTGAMPVEDLLARFRAQPGKADSSAT